MITTRLKGNLFLLVPYSGCFKAGRNSADGRAINRGPCSGDGLYKKRFDH